MSSPLISSRRGSATALIIAVTALSVAAAPAVARSVHNGWWRGGITFTSSVFATGNGITHAVPGGRETIAQPDDITTLSGLIYVGFQNGVGPQGQPSTSGNTDSTIVAFNRWGNPVAKWDVVGKCDGLTADPQIDRVIATVNEDADSSLYLINPYGGTTHYQYSEPLPHHGGTDAITIHDRMVLISGSAPGTTGTESAPQATFPAVYVATFDQHTRIADVTPLFFDEDLATAANIGASNFGAQVNLALTDPDSNENVPSYANRFAGDFMLTSQGDQEQIFVRDAGTPWQRLSVLSLSASVDDTAWPSDSRGTLYTTDNGTNAIYAIKGAFRPGEAFVATTPCDENSAPATCPAPGYPANYLGELDPWSGVITPVTLTGPAPAPQGMLFLP